MKPSLIIISHDVIGPKTKKSIRLRITPDIYSIYKKLSKHYEEVTIGEGDGELAGMLRALMYVGAIDIALRGTETSSNTYAIAAKMDRNYSKTLMLQLRLHLDALLSELKNEVVSVNPARVTYILEHLKEKSEGMPDNYRQIIEECVKKYFFLVPS